MNANEVPKWQGHIHLKSKTIRSGGWISLPLLINYTKKIVLPCLVLLWLVLPCYGIMHHQTAWLRLSFANNSIVFYSSATFSCSDLRYRGPPQKVSPLYRIKTILTFITRKLRGRLTRNLGMWSLLCRRGINKSLDFCGGACVPRITPGIWR